MKNSLFFLSFLIIISCFANYSIAQVTSKTYQSKNKLKLKPKEIKKLTFVELEGGEKKFPDSYLLGMRDNNLILATDIANNWTDKSLFVKSEINLKKYDYLTLLNRKEKHRKMAIWGTIFGAVGYYFAQKEAKPTAWETRNKRILGQPANNGRAEGIIGAITGAGLGIIIGTQLAKRRINLKTTTFQSSKKIKRI